MTLKDRYDLWIDGAARTAGRYAMVRTPYDGAAFAEAALGCAADIEAAVQAADRRRTDAAKLSAFARYEILARAARRLADSAETFARAIALESGKPISEARVEVARAEQTLMFSAEEARRLGGEVLPLDAHPRGAGCFGFTLRVPRGVVAAITPFNFPLNLVCHKVGPALAAGNTVVLKPASNTPVSAYLLAELLAECGLPAGFLNVVSGPGGELGDALVKHPLVRMVSFTGSVPVGTRIRDLAGLKPVTLELGNNGAVIVDDSADPLDAATRCAAGAFANSGQVCISLQRAYVHAGIADAFAEALRAQAEALPIGPPLEEPSRITSLIREADAARVMEWIDEARRGGARLVTGGQRVGAATVRPTVLADVPDEARLSREEAFAPVVNVNRFTTFEDAIQRVNRSAFGLQSAVFTRDLSRALRAARELEVGGVMINESPSFRVDQMPYGGVKSSGLGREGPKYACAEMTELRTVVIRV